MGRVRKFSFLMTLVLLVAAAGTEIARAAEDTFSGVYRAILLYNGQKFFQHADITLRTIQAGQGLVPLATVKVIFGERDSNEYMTFEYDQVKYDFVTGQLSMKSDKNELSFKGIMRINQGTVEGEWSSSTLGGTVGKFSAKRGLEGPKSPEEGLVVKTLTGFYRGEIANTNPQSNIPERVTVSLVTTQELTPNGPVLKVSGNTRLYLGDFGSLDYIELKLTDINFNYYTRLLTMRTTEYGLTYKGTMTYEGKFVGKVYADGIGEAGTISVTQQ